MLERTKLWRVRVAAETARLELTLALEPRLVLIAVLDIGQVRVRAAATTATLACILQLDRAAATTAAREHTLDQQLQHVIIAVPESGLV